MLIRAAGPSDIDLVADTILAAQRGQQPRGYFDIALDLDAAQCLAFVRRLTTADVRSWWRLSHFWVAEHDGVAAAALCALPVAGSMANARQAVQDTMTAAGFTDQMQAAVAQRGAYVRQCWMDSDESAWMIEHVATRPSHRGLGLAARLLDHALAQGRDLGFPRAQITFYIGNDAAERSYARAGFSFAEEKRHPDFAAVTGAAGFRRFAMAL
ncbi:GNAT family N-acetyltransferase [Bradyrhizobium sp. U87765 SZCCT0131]|nr:GNAT family N-acetyltransferase [Bradyrhizobium sp. U87765 SZCCT0131]MBR1261608.1 GNAT family N-acetyltransferase [Bradyrhizobium sp. U87765 SZCCT0134]MBR1306539.1 GNAT family N-acetyltransferase [Bradyrhizobium sp. U87765 SZCCT0110]MBR1317390.1 GNAT family N-acetyltransferase [Bradyrhizobium sp. U87765 SZCCT0109]MBR1351092.1 GNAT family N-acetyltransferase [Bradyrhizobium sp. U87765 SZCCT0048]